MIYGNRWLSSVSVDQVMQKLNASKSGIVIDPVFLESFMIYANTMLANTYDDVRVCMEDLVNPVAPPAHYATIMLAIETMGMKMPFSLLLAIPL